jgi:hypothetical protein
VGRGEASASVTVNHDAGNNSPPISPGSKSLHGSAEARRDRFRFLVHPRNVIDRPLRHLAVEPPRFAFVPPEHVAIPICGPLAGSRRSRSA